MLTFFDYLPSQNGWKVRQVLKLLAMPHETRLVSIFEGEGEGQAPGYLRINPWGAVPAIVLDDGQVLSESNAILWFLAAGSECRPADEFDAAKTIQWLSFEADYVQASMGSLRYWTLTGKLPNRPDSLVAGKRAAGERALAVLDRQFAQTPFIIGERFTIADISLFAYAHLAGDAGIELSRYRHVTAWVDRVRRRPRFLAEVHPYAIDPHSGAELP